MKKRAYRATGVKNVRVETLLSSRTDQPVDVGVNVGKDFLVVALRWNKDEFEQPWRVENPWQIGELVQRLQQLTVGRRLRVALEPTGTYGDPLRQALADAGLATFRVSPKAAHDYAEIFDGVPSQHDGKDAAIVAELLAMGRASPWKHEPASEWEQELRYWVDQLAAEHKLAVMWQGRLEGLLARHWPECSEYLKLSSRTLLSALAHYGGPAVLAADGEQALTRLRRWSRGKVSAETRQALFKSAAHSFGLRQTTFDVRRLREYAQKALAALGEVNRVKKRLKELARKNRRLMAQAAAVGEATACVLWAYLGDPKNYHCGEAYRKAMGLNLKERSSGRFEGQLKLTKRGHGQVRRWLYFAALRLLKKAPLDRWYARKRLEEKKEKKELVVSVMRKLALALYQVGAKDSKFQVTQLIAKERVQRKRRRRRAS